MSAPRCLPAAGALLVLLAAGCAHAEPRDAVLDALAAEMARNASSLKLPDAPPIYHLRYHLTDLRTTYGAASFGGLVEHQARNARRLGMQLRVGTPGLDNTGFGGWETGSGSRGLPARPLGRADRLEAWLLTDEVYKEAVEQHARKVAVFTPPADHPGDFEVLPPTVWDGGVTDPPDGDALMERVRRLSGVFARVPGLEGGRAVLGSEAGFDWIADTDGTRVRRPWAEVSISAVAKVRAADGMLLSDHLLWSVRRPDQLPAQAEMEAAVEAVARELAGLAGAELFDEEYVGPVLFEDQAALELFRHLLIPQLEGTPPVRPFEEFLEEHGRSTGTRAAALVRLRRRVLPLGWSVSDDPLRDPGHPASYTHDAEGTPARAVELVGDGIVRTVVMCRTPRKGVPGSNGHARGGAGSRLQGRVTLTEVQPGERLERAALRKRALRLASSYGLDHVMVVRRLLDDSFLPPEFFGEEQQTLMLPPPVAVYRVYADGREEPRRGAAFAGVHRWVLRDIMAAGPQVDGTYMAPHESGGRRGGVIIGLPTWLSAPEVLVGEMELVPVPPDPREKRVVPAPALPAALP